MRTRLTGLLAGCALSIMGQTSYGELYTNDATTENLHIIPNDKERDYDRQLLAPNRDKEYFSDCLPGTGEIVTFHDSVYAERLYSLPTEIELPFNSTVRSYIERYVKYGRKQVSRMLGEGMYYFPLFEEILDREGLPIELKYFPVIESALSPTVRSRMGATGLWQFMDRTGKAYNLEIGNQVDERRDPVKSTQAAAKYLKKLYATYEDWSLVIAAYNCGSGNVNRAIRRSGGKKDYWAIYPYLPKETRNYVPAFIAATYIMNYYNEHNICPAECGYSAFMDSLKINKKVNFKQIADIAGISIADLRKYNPQFKKDIIPGDRKEYTLNMPARNVLAYIDYEAKNFIRQLPADEIELARNEKDNFVGESDAMIESIQAMYENDGLSSVVQQAQTVISYHHVNKGETLNKIAKVNDVTVEEIKEWNNLSSNNAKVGWELKIIKIEYVAVEQILRSQLKQPELLAIKTDAAASLRILDNYLKGNEKITGEQRLFQHLEDSESLRMLAESNNIDYQVHVLPKKKKSIWGKFTNTVNIAFSSVKDWGESISGKNRKSGYGEELLAGTSSEPATIISQNTNSPEVELSQLSTGKDDLFVPSEKEAALSRADIASNNDGLVKFYHKVRIGETISQIAARYKVSRDDIVVWNNLNTELVRVRQRLLIFIPKDKRLATNRAESTGNI